MSDIKVIEGLKPWEVMKRASEGEPVAAMFRGSVDGKLKEIGMCRWDWATYLFFIIDTSKPEFDWDGFNWDFFNQYGGLWVDCGIETIQIDSAPSGTPAIGESPFYYWHGGEQPVPDNVEVEGIYREGDKGPQLKARDYHWQNDGADDDIIAFRITGKVL
jgi:hypothetical protein